MAAAASKIKFHSQSYFNIMTPEEKAAADKAIAEKQAKEKAAATEKLAAEKAALKKVEKVQTPFDRHPKLDMYFKTSDNEVFYTENDAKLHSKSLDDKNVTKVERKA